MTTACTRPSGSRSAAARRGSPRWRCSSSRLCRCWSSAAASALSSPTRSRTAHPPARELIARVGGRWQDGAMPESPEVEALARFLADEASGREIRAVDVLEFRTVKTRSAPPTGIAGRTITGAARHGKHVELLLDEKSLVVSLGRHGWMRWVSADSAGAESVVPADAPPALAALDLSGDIALEVTDAGS